MEPCNEKEIERVARKVLGIKSGLYDKQTIGDYHFFATGDYGSCFDSYIPEYLRNTLKP